MGVLDRFRRRAGHAVPVPTASARGRGDVPVVVEAGHAPPGPESDASPIDVSAEAELWAGLRENPNDAEAFHALAEIVRRRAADSQTETVGGDRQRAADDAVWSLAEELAHSSRAWYPLVELARLSLHDDREAALRRLATAADRDSEGQALAVALGMLRDERMPAEAVNLATGHWRPREHGLEAGRQVVEAAIEAGRVGDARRHLTALEGHPDAEGVQQIREELTPLIDRAEAQLPPGTPAGGIPIIDLRELREASNRNPFRRH